MKKKKKVLLIEPNYSNKYPPIGLMKISTYYKNRGWEVVFFKGDLKQFVIERLADHCIEELSIIDNSIDWKLKKDIIVEVIKNRTKQHDDELELEKSDYQLLLIGALQKYKDNYRKGTWKTEPEWDRVCVTTLFTFYWDITVETIEMAKYFVKNPKKDMMVGGVLASIQPKELEAATGIKPFVGVLNIPGQLDKGDKQIIDELPLDYSILDEIDYKYPMSNAFYGYTSRGCIRHCAFCAVPTLEPVYTPFIPLTERVRGIRELYGDQKDMLLMDNNVLASANFPEIVEQIKACGFEQGAKFVQPNLYEIAIRNLRNGINDRAYIRKAQSLIIELYDKITNKDESYEFYSIISRYHLLKLLTTTKENLLASYDEIMPFYQKHHKPGAKGRFVDFNQGLDARLFTEENVKLLSSIAIRPLRVAFDDIHTFPAYNKAIRMSAAAGIKDFSNYLLYNFKDKPLDLYQRLRINVEMCDELNVNIYSFPMKYHPLRKEADGSDYSHNRDYIGVHWNRKYVRAIQAILNSTKGKVGRGQSFFLEAFGATEDEYMELLEMPETFILYRFFFKWLDESHGMGTDHWRKCWKECMTTLPQNEIDELLRIIHRNEFSADEVSTVSSALGKKLLTFYTNYRKDIITPGTMLYQYKQEYDSNPTFKLRRAQPKE